MAKLSHVALLSLGILSLVSVAWVYKRSGQPNELSSTLRAKARLTSLSRSGMPIGRQRAHSVSTARPFQRPVEVAPVKPKRKPRMRGALPKIGGGLLLLAGSAGGAHAASKAVEIVVKPTMEEVVLTKVIPSIGTVLSNALYFSFAPGVAAALKAGSLGALNPIPVATQLYSTIAWSIYGLAIKNPFVTASNVPAIILSMWAVASLTPLINDKSQLKSFQNLLVAGSAAVSGLWALLIFFVDPTKHAFVAGLFATAICIILFASPLTAMKSVIEKKDASSIYAPFAIVQTVNCLMWFLYGLKIDDVMIFGPNATGLILAIIQLALLIIFPSKAKATEVDPDSSKGALA